MTSRDILNKNILFPGSSQIFIEYHDVLGTPMMSLLYAHSNTPSIYHEMFDFSVLSTYSPGELFLWYICRKHQNFLIDINKIKLSDDDCDKILIDMLHKSSDTYITSYGPLMQLLENITASKVCDDVVVWSKYEESHIRDTLRGVSKNLKFQYVYGPINRQIARAPEYTSFIFSDHQNVPALINNPKKGFRLYTVQPLGYNRDTDVNKKLDADLKRVNIPHKTISIMKGLPTWGEHVKNLKIVRSEDKQ